MADEVSKHIYATIARCTRSGAQREAAGSSGAVAPPLRLRYFLELEHYYFAAHGDYFVAYSSKQPSGLVVGFLRLRRT